MCQPASITDAEAKRLAAIVRHEGVRLQYQRSPEMPVIEILPAFPNDTHKPEELAL